MRRNFLSGVELKNFAAVCECLEINIYGDRKNTGGRLKKLAYRSDKIGDDCCQSVLAYGISKVCKD